MVIKDAAGIYDLVELEVGNHTWHDLTSLNHHPIHCAVLTETGKDFDNWKTLFNLRGD